MSDKTKDIILKTLLVIATILMLMGVPGGFIIAFFVHDEKILTTIMHTILFAFFGVGILFIILLLVFGGLKQKPVKAERFPITIGSYEELLGFLQKRLPQKEYQMQKAMSISCDGELTLYSKPIRGWTLDCFVIIRVAELSNELIELSNDSITNILTEYYGGKTITDSVNITALFCVDRITPAFQKLVNINMEQGLKNGRMLAGISFGGKNIYIAKQEGGFGIVKYKQLRREFIDIIGLNTEDRILNDKTE